MGFRRGSGAAFEVATSISTTDTVLVGQGSATREAPVSLFAGAFVDGFDFVTSASADSRYLTKASSSAFLKAGDVDYITSACASSLIKSIVSTVVSAGYLTKVSSSAFLKYQNNFTVLGPFALTTPSGDVVSANNIDSFFMYQNFFVTSVYATLKTSPTTTGIMVDINRNGSSILSTKLTIDQAVRQSVSASIQPVIASGTISVGDEVSFDVVSVDTGNTAGGLKVYLKGYFINNA